MDDIYQKLSKHFLGEASPDEELEIVQFKKENEKEYQALALLWKKGEISIKEFDSHKAWKIITAKQPGRIIPLYSHFKRVAVVAILLMSILALYYFYAGSGSHSIDIITQKNVDTKVKLVQLIDGTKVWLNKNATLSYTKGFTGNERKVSLEGEAFFEVTKNSKRPFIVSTGYSTIVVLGTSFNVNTTSFQTEVSVVTGKVKVSSLSNPENSVVILPDYTAVSTNETLTSYANKNANYLSWKTGVFVFDNTPISQVIADVNTYYPEQISIKDSKNVACTLKAKFNQVKLSEIINVISLTCKVDIKINPYTTNIKQQ